MKQLGKLSQTLNYCTTNGNDSYTQVAMRFSGV